jgi:hypothetical protein
MPSDTYTEVTRQGWGSRLRGSFKGILFGLILIAFSFWLLFWNEGRAVRRYKALAEGSGVVVSVASDRVDPAYEGKLVHLSGPVTTEEILTDPDFGVAAQALHLERQVEMYQWRESSESETKKKVGGSTETTTTYTYDKEWSSRPIDSSGFKQPSGHENPPMPYQGREVSASRAFLGAFQLSPGLLGKIRNYQPLPIDSLNGVPSSVRFKARLSNGGIYLGSDPSSPRIGDLRITFRVVPPTTVSLVSQQTGRTFQPYQARTGSVELLQTGVVDAAAMFESAQRGNRVTTWILRVVGFFLMFFGFKTVLKPFSVMADVLPPVGNLVAAGTGMISFLLAAMLSLLTIAVAWVFYRPLLGVFLLLVAAGIVVLIVRKMKKAKAAPSPGPPRTAAPPPPPPPPPAAS